MRNFKTIIKKITALTDNNYHCESLIEGAKLIGNDRLIKIFTDISEEHTKIGYMPAGLCEMRMGYSLKLMTIAQNMLSAGDYESFHGAY